MQLLSLGCRGGNNNCRKQLNTLRSYFGAATRRRHFYTQNRLLQNQMTDLILEVASHGISSKSIY
uniref:Uncharacterized protein n=1 Tax=Anguilla anguilla TaxID=7936 RepID=A0A0E9UNR2_ANGAN